MAPCGGKERIRSASSERMGEFFCVRVYAAGDRVMVEAQSDELCAKYVGMTRVQVIREEGIAVE